MAKEESDASKLEWKYLQEPVARDLATDPKGVSAQKRVPKKMREIPEFYFLPRRSLLFNLTFYGACIAGGIGAGMLVEKWINKKVAGNGSPSSVYHLNALIGCSDCKTYMHRYI